MTTQYDGNSIGPVTFAFLAGCLVGAGAALLLAPQSGEETRNMLKDYAKDAQDKAWEKAKEAKGAFDSAVEQGKEFIDDQKGALTASVDAGREALKKERDKAFSQGVGRH